MLPSRCCHSPFVLPGSCLGDPWAGLGASMRGPLGVFHLPIFAFLVFFWVLGVKVCFLRMSQPVCLFLHLPGGLFWASKRVAPLLACKFSWSQPKIMAGELFFCCLTTFPAVSGRQLGSLWWSFGGVWGVPDFLCAPILRSHSALGTFQRFHRMSLAKSRFLASQVALFRHLSAAFL